MFSSLMKRVSRYCVSNSYELWKLAPPEGAAKSAFRAIASDPALLQRLDAKTASVMVEDAEQIASTGNSTGKAESGTLYGPVAPIVIERIEHWRSSASHVNSRPKFVPMTNPSGRRAGPQSFLAPKWESIPGEFRSAWNDAFDSYPHFSGRTGDAVAATVLKIGAGGVHRLKSPMGEIFAVIAARFAARCSQGGYIDAGMTNEKCLDVIRVVQEWALMADQTPLSMGYHGLVGTYPERARILAYDALSCADLAYELSRADGNPSFADWEAVAERHAYVAVALDPMLLATVDYDRGQKIPSAMDYDCSQTLRDHDSQVIAAAVARFAISLIERPTLCDEIDVPGFVHLPKPSAVLAVARTVLPYGVPLRRSPASPTSATQRYRDSAPNTIPGWAEFGTSRVRDSQPTALGM